MYKTLGMSYRAFLGSTRAEHARVMLIKTTQSVLEIALECGYPNVRSFQRHFKELSGLSPTEYRKEIAMARSSAVQITEYPCRIRKDIVII